MPIEYRLSYTAAEIDEKLGRVDSLVASVNGIVPDDNGNVQITILDSGGNVAQNAVLFTEQELTAEQQIQARDNIGIEDVFTAEVAGSSGINLNDGVYEIGRFSTSGTEYDNEGNFAFRNVNYLPVEGGRTIVVYFDAAEWNGNRINWGVELVQYDSSGAVIENKRHYIENYLNNSKSSFTLDANAAYIRIHYNRNGEMVFEDMTAPKIAIYYIEDAVQEFVEYGAGAETVLMVRKDRVQGLVALAGKKIVYDGDSICAGSVANAGGGYARIIADLTGGEYVNHAVGGGHLCSGVANRHCVADNLANLPTDGDIYCFQGGINDYWGNAVLGTYTHGDYTGAVDATTVCGALETIFRYALNNFPSKPVFFVITHKIQNTAYQKNGAGNTFEDYRDAMAGICQKYSVPFYDAFSESGLNGWNDAQNNLYLTGNTNGTPDGCHPNEDGYRRFYVDQLIDLFESGRSSGSGSSGWNVDLTEQVARAEAAANSANTAMTTTNVYRSNAKTSETNAANSAANSENAAIRAESAAKRAEEAVENAEQGSGGNVDLTGVVKSVNGQTPDENGNVEIETGEVTDKQISDAINAYLNENPLGVCNIYVGTEQPTDGTEYWLDTSADENGNTGSGGDDSGSGDDSGNEPIVYTIARTLTGCTSSSTAASISAGSFYKETITADSGYTLSGATVNITMGGVDISDSFVDGVLTIDEVNGNIVISVIAKGNAWETLTLSSVTVGGVNNGGPIYSDEGATEIGKMGRGAYTSEAFNTDTFVSVTVSNNGVLCYVGYGIWISDGSGQTKVYGASSVATSKTQTVELTIPSGQQLIVVGNYPQHWTVEAKKQV